MAAGAILKEQLLATSKLLVKENEDVRLGELVCDDGAGLVAATATLIADGKVVYMSTEEHVYADEEELGDDHYIVCVEVGYVEVIKKTGNDIKKGSRVIVSATAGEADVWAAPASGSTYDQAAEQANYDIMMGIIGRCAEDCLNADVTMKVLIGVM